MPSVGMTVAGQVICQQNPGGSMTFARIDGRNVISLPFNPYLESQDDPDNKKDYDQAMKEIQDQRERLKQVSKINRDKQEAVNLKKAWLNIVKKDIPKAYKQY